MSSVVGARTGGRPDEPAPASPPAEPAPVNAKRELRLAVLLVLLGAGLLLVSAGRVWLTGVEVLPAPLPSRDVQVDAGELGSPVGALALVVLAGVPALAATRRTGRVVVGVLLTLAGAAAALSAARVLLDPAAASATLASDVPADALATNGWPAVAVLGGLLALAAGALVAVRGRRWAQLGRRHEAPMARTASDEPTAHAPAARSPGPPSEGPASPPPLSDDQAAEGPLSGDPVDRATTAGATPDGAASGSSVRPVGEAQLWDALDRGEDPTRG